MKSIRPKLFVFIFASLMVYVIFFYSYLFNYKQINIKSNVDLEYVVVHLDLKGAAPKLKYLESLLLMLKNFEVNGILMEYEDMFPYEGKLVNLSSKNHYDKEELENFLMKAVKLKIEVIPLVQTFGHMEHVLKLEEFRHLREHPVHPDSICPSNSESIDLVYAMLEQVIHLHTRITPLKHIHIGCDEVYHMNKCDRCRSLMTASEYIFINYVSVVKTMVSNLSPDTKVLMWDDMFRKIVRNNWNAKSMAELHQMEPVYWDYVPVLGDLTRNLYYYHKAFENIWIASAFKGAEGPLATLPNITCRYNNHHSWMTLIMNYKFAGQATVFNFKGIILTGWSRYSHLEPLCELLPASMPSLILNLQLVQRFRHGIYLTDNFMNPTQFFDKYLAFGFYRDLRCKGLFKDISNFYSLSAYPLFTCGFEGNSLFHLMRQYNYFMTEIEKDLTNNKKCLQLTEYYILHKHFNMYNVNSSIAWCVNNLRGIIDWEKRMSKVMTEYYDDDVITEYVSSKVYNVKKKLRNMLEMLKDYMATQSWERRPYTEQ